MLFAEKKDAEEFFTYMLDYHSLNANIVTDARLLRHVLMTGYLELKGARVFTSLALRDNYH